MIEKASDTASIDLSVAFFSAILALFVFVDFNTSREPPDPQADSLGQSQVTQEVRPATFQPVNYKGGFAMLADADRLFVFDMAEIGEGIVDLQRGNPSREAGLSLTAAGAAPNAFDLTWRFVPGAPYPDWVNHDVDLSTEVPDCPDALAPLLTVFIASEVEDVSPLLRFAQTCQTHLRFEFVRLRQGKDAPSTRRIIRSEGIFTGERVFR